MGELDAYDFDLPPERIAQEPKANRADARLLLADRVASELQHYHVRDLPELLRPGDLLVFNESKVIPARLVGHRVATQGRWQGLFLEVDSSGCWRILGKTRGKLQPGESLMLEDREGRPHTELVLLAKLDGGQWAARPRETPGEPPGHPSAEDAAFALLEKVGRVPLPPYIRGGQMVDWDRDQYQTVYARTPGSVAAPTAGLHFTSGLLDRLASAGVETAFVTLHVGLGTFRPVNVERLADHQMHTEWCRLPGNTVTAIERARAAGGRVIAVGTTTLRTLESAWLACGSLAPWSGSTDLFIRPPFAFRVVQGLLTNFHLPKSTLLVLVRTFGTDALIREAYAEAIREEYRFFSYGDAMLIL